jgi:DNA-binding NtrC family response regulator
MAVMEIKSLKSKEKELLETVLGKTHWNIEKTSRLMKISVSQIKRKIRAYDLQNNNFLELKDKNPSHTKKEEPK